MKLNKYNVIGMLVLGILVFSASMGIAAATDDDNDSIDDDFEEEKKRDIGVEIEADKIEVESILRSGLTKNKIEFNIQNDSNGVEIGVEYTPDYDSSSNSSEIELEFEVTFKEIVEYVDVDDNGMYNDSIDTEIQVLALSNFQPTYYEVQSISNDTDLHYFLVTTTDGVFSAHIFIAEEFEIVNDTLITPSETKIDIEIDNFNYLNQNSRLALYTKLESGIDYEEHEDTEDEENEYDDNEAGVFTSNNTNVGFFTWKKNATIDGISQAVLISDIEDDEFEPNEQKLYMNYPNGTLIYHDPKIGIEGLSSSTNNPPPPPGSTIPGFELITFLSVSVIGVIVVGYIVYKKKSRK